MSEFQMSRRASVWVLPLETGGCGATLQSIYALLAPTYAGELRRQGISFARSPRHADIVLLAGPLSLVARGPVERMLAGVPEPRALVAVGDCAIDGCVFAGSAAITDHPADVLDVHVEVGGCPPTPSAILAAIVEAKRLLAGEDEEAVEADVEDENVDGDEAVETIETVETTEPDIDTESDDDVIDEEDDVGDETENDETENDEEYEGDEEEPDDEAEGNEAEGDSKGGRDQKA